MITYRTAARNLLLTCALALLGVAAFWSLRLAWADRLSRAEDPQTVTRAARLSPGNADFRVKLARALNTSGGDSHSALQAAALLNPADARVWMRLGLNAEMRGDYVTAERHLLAATRVSRLFEPRSTLAGYYFRRGDAAHFWPWVQQALLMGNGDLDPVFALCWKVTSDAGMILNQAIPERRAVLNPYLRFLLQEHRLDAAAAVAHKLVGIGTEADRPELLALIDRQLQARETPAALETWNRMCWRRILPYAPLNPENGASLTDGAFAADSTGGGFAWHLDSAPGVACGRNTSPRYVWLSFSGAQPARYEPLSEYLVVAPGAHYRLRYLYRTSDWAPESGISWQVLDTAGGAQLIARSPWLSSPEWKTDETRFTAPASNPLVRLVLTYQSAPGATRIEGSVLLRRVELERLS